MDNNLTYYEFTYEQPALPEKIIFVTNENSITRVIIKNCGNSSYDFQIPQIEKKIGEFYNSIDVSYFTTDKCNINNLRIRFPLIKNYENKISPYEITFKEGKPKFLNLAKYESNIEWLIK